MFRFTIRDVLRMTVVAGLAYGWWRDEFFAQRGSSVVGEPRSARAFIEP